MADFQQFYGLDLSELWTGGLSARRVLILSEHLKDIPDSRYRAATLGGPQFLGWDDDRYLAADTRDFMLAILTSLGGQKLTAEDLYPRPERAEDMPQEAATIAEFNPGAFIRWLTS
jgi:hypothetical protein